MRIFTLITSLLFSFSLYPQTIKDTSVEYFIKARKSEQKKEYDAALYYYQKAAESDPSNYNIYELWVELLDDLGEVNPIYYFETGKVYTRMIELKPDNPINYNDWGCCLLRLSKHTNNLNIYKSKIESLFFKAEELSDQLGAYNLACLYSLLNKKDEAFKWLTILLSKNYKLKERRITRNLILNDPDFSNIRNERKFKEILDNYFPEKDGSTPLSPI